MSNLRSILSTSLFSALMFSAASSASAPAPAGHAAPDSKFDKHYLFQEDSAKKLVPLDSRRSDLFAGQTIEIWHNRCKVTVTIDEQPRNSRIHDDFKRLIGSLRGTLEAAGGTNPCDTGPVYEASRYELKHKRSLLKVIAKDADDAELEAVTVTTGPKEHLYLGVDLPVNSTKTLKYDSSSSSLVPKDDDPQLYLSFNFLLGDVADDPKNVKGLGALSLKTFVLASDRPLDSLGIGLGYRLPDFSSKTLGLDLTAFSIFAGYFWTKQDAVDGTVPEVNGDTATKWRFGVSYDLSTGLGWVKW